MNVTGTRMTLTEDELVWLRIAVLSAMDSTSGAPHPEEHAAYQHLYSKLSRTTAD